MICTIFFILGLILTMIPIWYVRVFAVLLMMSSFKIGEWRANNG